MVLRECDIAFRNGVWFSIKASLTDELMFIALHSIACLNSYKPMCNLQPAFRGFQTITCLASAACKLRPRLKKYLRPAESLRTSENASFKNTIPENKNPTNIHIFL